VIYIKTIPAFRPRIAKQRTTHAEHLTVPEKRRKIEIRSIRQMCDIWRHNLCENWTG